MSYAADTLQMSERDRQDRQIAETVRRESGRLRSFIRRRMVDERDVEDVLQEVFFELVEAYRLMKPIEQVGAWLFRVARNRMTDLFRRRRPHQPGGAYSAPGLDDDPGLPLAELLPSPAAGPEEELARALLLDELEAALDELPPEQRAAFVAHQIEGHSFKELSEATGTPLNTLLSRKHQAVLHLRRRLRAIHDEFVSP